MKDIGLGEFRVDMRRVDVSRHRREQFDIAMRERAHEARAIANLHFIEGAVGNRPHDVPLGLSENVIAGVYVFEVAGQSFGGVVDQKRGDIAHIVDDTRWCSGVRSRVRSSRLVEAIDAGRRAGFERPRR